MAQTPSSSPGTTPAQRRQWSKFHSTDRRGFELEDWSDGQFFSLDRNGEEQEVPLGDVGGDKANPDPIEKGCPCYTCQRYTKRMLSTICAKESIASVLLTIHNITFMHNLLLDWCGSGGA